MKKLKQPRKLPLAHETVRALSEVKLNEVVGGFWTFKYGCDSGGHPCTQ